MRAPSAAGPAALAVPELPAFQASLLDVDVAEQLGPLERLVRTPLGSGAWVDVLPGWLRGADALFERLRDTVPWRAERRQMYERVVAVPRLLAFYDEGVDLPDPLVTQMKQTLDVHYADELGEPFTSAGLCLYRDGRDSVAWHGDRIGRSSTQDTMVAIVSVGDPRTLLLRPNGGATALRHELGHGDLLVMGGSCQRTWEHCVPKTNRAAGPRISIQFRTRGVR
jgi:alkylated DNA repair dioxygenase AlkB